METHLTFLPHSFLIHRFAISFFNFISSTFWACQQKVKHFYSYWWLSLCPWESDWVPKSGATGAEKKTEKKWPAEVCGLTMKCQEKKHAEHQRSDSSCSQWIFFFLLILFNSKSISTIEYCTFRACRGQIPTVSEWHLQTSSTLFNCWQSKNAFWQEGKIWFKSEI